MDGKLDLVERIECQKRLKEILLDIEEMPFDVTSRIGVGQKDVVEVDVYSRCQRR
jgi:hypothetical protein